MELVKGSLNTGGKVLDYVYIERIADAEIQLVNGNFSNATWYAGWNGTGSNKANAFISQKGGTFGDSDNNNVFAEMWTNSSFGAEGTVYQVLINMPAGNYALSANILNNVAEGAAVLYAKVGSADEVSTSAAGLSAKTAKTVVFNVASPSNVVLGYKTTNITGKSGWIAVDDFGLKQFVTGTIASSGYSSLASAYALDFSSATGINAAYIVSEASISAGTAKLEAVNELPAGEGVILKGTPGAAYSIPVVANASPVTNLLKGAVEAYDCAANEVYILKNGELHLVTEASTVPAGKAYLPADNVAAAPALMFVFADDMQTTGINAVKGEGFTVNGYYDLQGRKVANPTKGMYIVNGKKVIVK